METRILATLANWGEVTGWELWADEEGIADQLKQDTDPKGKDYGRFKRQLERLADLGYVEKTDDERRLAKATWSITQAGKHRIEQPQASGVEWESYIGKRVKAGTSIPREVYRELMLRHRNGELDLAFLRPRASDEENRR